jgi:hypothetical protein
METDMAQRSDAIARVSPILDCHRPLVELLVDLPKVATTPARLRTASPRNRLPSNLPRERDGNEGFRALPEALHGA